MRCIALPAHGLAGLSCMIAACFLGHMPSADQPTSPPPASQTLVCRRTLAGHTDDILSLSGVSVQLPPPDIAELASPKSPTAAVIAGIRWVGGGPRHGGGKSQLLQSFASPAIPQAMHPAHVAPSTRPPPPAARWERCCSRHLATQPAPWPPQPARGRGWSARCCSSVQERTALCGSGQVSC